MITINRAVRKYQLRANWEYAAECRFFWKGYDQIRTHFNKIGVIAITAVIACASLPSCRAPMQKDAPVHSLPVSARSGQSTLGAAAPDPNALAITHVRELPLYKQAQQSCTAKHYSQAADLLLQLSRTTNFSPEEVEFCLTQVDVCRKDGGLGPLPQSTVRLAVTAGHRPPATNNQFADCGPPALALVCAQLKVPADLAALRKAAGTTKDGTTMEGLAKAAKSVGLKAEGVQTGRDALPHLQMPAIAWTGNHYVAVLSVSGGPRDAGTARIHDPNEDHEAVISQESLLRRSFGG